ncbi:hypothetical protein KQI52_14545 [bacterium]|nr:hypothetical protein [bacterium]
MKTRLAVLCGTIAIMLVAISLSAIGSEYPSATLPFEVIVELDFYESSDWEYIPQFGGYAIFDGVFNVGTTNNGEWTRVRAEITTNNHDFSIVQYSYNAPYFWGFNDSGNVHGYATLTWDDMSGGATFGSAYLELDASLHPGE